MKRLVFLLLFLPALAWGQLTGNCVQFYQTDPGLGFYWIRCLGPSTDSQVYYYNGGTQMPDTLHVGSAGASVVNADTAAQARSAISAFAQPAGTTAQYIRGDGTLATFPTGARTFNFPTRSLNTAFQISTTQDAIVVYSADLTVTSPILAGTTGRVFLEYADDSGFTTNVKSPSQTPNGTSGVLNLQNLGPGGVVGVVPAGKWVRIRTANVAGTPTFALTSSFEVLL